MFAIGNDELGPPAGETIKCLFCGEDHLIEYGTAQHMLKDGTMTEPEVSKELGFYTCEGNSYLASVNGRLLR